MEIAEVVARYGSAWAEPGEEARREILVGCWAPDGVYVDPSARADGLEALVAHIGSFQQTFAGHRIEQASAVDAHSGHFRFAWRMLGPDGGEVMEGVDFGTIDADGRITLICGFFGPWPEAS